MNKLTATAVKQAKPDQEKAIKLTDGGGMYLLITPSGGRYWRYDYRYAGKRNTHAIGTYPELSLADAREAHVKARALLAKGQDPNNTKRSERIRLTQSSSNDFESISNEWFDRKLTETTEGHRKRAQRILKNDLCPDLGSRPIDQISAFELLTVLKKIEARGAIDIAHRAKQMSGRIFRYAISTGRATIDPSRDLDEALIPKKKKHRAAFVTPSDVTRLMIAINNYSGTPIVKAALQISALLFQRPNEIRHMEWQEIDWNSNQWKIPAEKKKEQRPHIVPLSKQAIAILRDLKNLTGTGKYVFPSARGNQRALSENGVRTALRTMGFTNEDMTPHGFRAMARTLLDEVLNYRVDWIEHQLAHAVKDANGRAYNRTTHLDGRIEMMQTWADYLDQLCLSISSNRH